jgi:hypothetical protein
MARRLTDGEVAMVRQLFGDAIDVSRVRVHARRYLPFGLQPKHCAMAPNGSLYFHHSCFRDDFSRASVRDQHWFMHEMVSLCCSHTARLRGGCHTISSWMSYRRIAHVHARSLPVR